MENKENSNLNENNEQLSTNNKSSILSKKVSKIVFTVIITLALLYVILFTIYKSTIDISTRNIDKFDRDLSVDTIEIKTDFLDYINYDSKKDKSTLHISIPKEYLYQEIIKIDEFNNELNDKYGLNINKFGFLNNAKETNTIDFYADVTYKEFLNAYITGSIEYKITENNGIDLYLKKIVIGDGLPMFLYQAFLPIKPGDLIYQIDPNEYELLKDNILKLDLIRNVKIDSNSLNFDFDYMSNLKSITKYVFGDDYDTSKIDISLENTIPVVLEAILGENQDEYFEIAKVLFPKIFKDYKVQ